MLIQMSKLKTVLFAISVFLTSAAVMWQTVEIVVANDLYMAFPEDEGIVTALMSWPGMLTSVASIVSGLLLSKVTTKVELILSSALMLTGVVMAFTESVSVLLVVSLLMAIGAGVANTAGMSILSEVFLDEKKRSLSMGLYSAVMAGSGALIGIIAGQLALGGWQVAFNTCWCAAVMLLLTIAFVPNIKPADRFIEEVAEDNPALSNERPFNGFFWAFAIGMFIFFSIYAGGPYLLLSVYMAENVLGDVDYVGLCTSLSTVGSCLSCIAFGFLYTKIHRKYALITIPALMVIMVWMSIAPSPVACAITQLLSGACYGATFSLMYAYCAEIIPMSKNGLAMGICTVATCASFTLGIYFYTILMDMFQVTLTTTLLWGAAVLIIPLVIEIIFMKKTTQKRAAMQAAAEAAQPSEEVA